MKKVLVINGPNLNMLGIRETNIYGKNTYEDLKEYIMKHARANDVAVEMYQSNYEGDIVTKIQQAYKKKDGIVINAGAYTHTSIAILDALKAVGIPTVEVHISKLDEREEFRQVSYVGMYACHKEIGKGFKGYTDAIDYLLDYLGNVC